VGHSCELRQLRSDFPHWSFIFEKQLACVMKTIGTALVAAFILIPWCGTTLFAQGTTSSAKIITIQKHTVHPDGTVEDETFIKKGEAAEDFDVKEYMEQNNQPGVSLTITERAEDGSYERTMKKKNPRQIQFTTRGLEEILEDTEIVVEQVIDDVTEWVDNIELDERPFLGVKSDSDEDPEEAGLVIEIVPCSPAYDAGLRNNDKIMTIDGAAINQWSDLTDALRDKKPGNQIEIGYERYGNAASTKAKLSTRMKVHQKKCNPDHRGFLGVSPIEDTELEKGVAVRVIEGSSASDAGFEDGDIILMMNEAKIMDWEDIEDFMSNTFVDQSIMVSYRRGDYKAAKEVTLKARPNQSASNVRFNINTDWEDQSDIDWNEVKIDARQKDACLGVYSSTSDDSNGTQISSFTDQSAAKEAGMEKGDVISQVNGIEVKSHDDLWNEIAKYQPGDEVSIAYARNDDALTVKATLKACRTENRVAIISTDDAGPKVDRKFYTSNWSEAEKERFKKRHVITIHKNEDGEQPETPPAETPASDRSLKLDSFKAFPNPSSGPITIEFSAEPRPTIITLLDLSGRQLFREEMNAFNGSYLQQFDLSEYAKGTVIIQVVQGDKLFTQQLVVN
jgi:S1-C subfamily serine protease